MTCSVHVLWFHTPWVKSSNPFLLDIWSHVREKKLWNLYRKTCVFSRFFTFRFIGNQKFSAIKTSNPSIYRIFGRMHVHEKNLSNLYIEGRELGLLPPDWEQEFESCCTMSNLCLKFDVYVFFEFSGFLSYGRCQDELKPIKGRIC